MGLDKGPDKRQGWRAFKSLDRQGDGKAVVFTCEHASSRWPEFHPCAARVDSCWLNDHYGWDPGAARLARAMAEEFGAAAVFATFSRLFIDANRGRDQADLIRASIGETRLGFNCRLTPEERALRLAIHDEYHAEVNRVCDATIQALNRFMLLSVHSFTPKLGDHCRRHIEIGLLHDEVNLRFAESYALEIERTGLSCVLNEPYSGYNGLVYAAARHGGLRSMPYLVIEVRSDLLTDEDRFDEVFHGLSSALTALLMKQDQSLLST